MHSGFFITYRHNDRNVWRRFWQRHLTWWVCLSGDAVCPIALPECNQCGHCEGNEGEVAQQGIPWRASHCLTQVHRLLLISVCVRSRSYGIIEQIYGNHTVDPVAERMCLL